MDNILLNLRKIKEEVCPIFNKLYGESRLLLKKILTVDDSPAMLAEMFEKCSYKEDEKLRGLMRELSELGYIKTEWASNVPYHIHIDNSAYTYFERESEYERITNQNKPATYNFSGNTQFIGANSGIVTQNNGIAVAEMAELITLAKSSLTDEFSYEQREMICDNLEAILEEIQKEKPKKGLLKAAWDGITTTLKGVSGAAMLLQNINRIGELIYPFFDGKL